MDNGVALDPIATEGVSSSSTPGELKVFIFGPARSGTSIMYYAMRDIFQLPGTGESHVMPAFQRAFHTMFQYKQNFLEKHPNDLASSLDPHAFRSYNLQFIRDFYRSVYPVGSWVDKTPGGEAIVGAKLVQEVFPDARLIFMKRTGIEVVQSFRAKFSVPFEDACMAWASAMEAISRTRSSCTNLIEVDQYDLTNMPGEAAGQVANHLGVPEKVEALTGFFVRRRTDQLSSHDWRRRLTLADVEWTETERNTFGRICGRSMVDFGYPM